MTKKHSKLGTIILVLAVLASVCIGVIMFGARLGLWDPIEGFGLYRQYNNLVGYVVTAIGAAGLVFLLATRRTGVFKAALACALGLAILIPVLKEFVLPTPRFPPIHDIATDTANPPQFLVLDESREGARNSLEYGGEDVAAAQQAAYPDIAPVMSELPATDAFAKALAIGKSMGWEIVSRDDELMRFEATARTPVFHFADDVVVAVTAVENGSRIDLRSVSRVGRGDRGVNAARVRAFISAM